MGRRASGDQRINRIMCTRLHRVKQSGVSIHILDRVAYAIIKKG
jgi:hypothetical protein